MPAPDGPQWWVRNWENNRNNAGFEGMSEKEKYSKDNDHIWNRSERRTPEAVQDWIQSSFFQKADFPTETLRSMDKTYQDSSNLWDPNPNVRKRQKAFKMPKNAPSAWEVNTAHPDFLHEQMKGTGVPEHVTIYHRGDIPDDAEYASGSLLPDWPTESVAGWAARDPNINRGRLHIFLVPHEDILAHGGPESEAFFRRGTPFRKTPRTNKEQRIAEIVAEDQFQW
jgi:hypothetical protein